MPFDNTPLTKSVDDEIQAQIAVLTEARDILRNILSEPTEFNGRGEATTLLQELGG